MIKMKEYYICDRCKKELSKNEINHCIDGLYNYDLCNECYEVFNKFKNEVKLLEDKYERIIKNFKFGRYLPKDLESEVN